MEFIQRVLIPYLDQGYNIINECIVFFATYSDLDPQNYVYCWKFNSLKIKKNYELIIKENKYIIKRRLVVLITSK